MRKELAVVLDSGIPVATVHVGVVESASHFTVHILEHVFTFLRAVHLHHCRIGDRGEFVAAHLVHTAAAQNEEVLAVLVGLNVGPLRVHLVDELGAVFAQVHLPEVVVFLHS